MLNPAEAPQPPERYRTMSSDEVVTFYDHMVENNIDI